jgi:hypothetical protein
LLGRELPRARKFCLSTYNANRCYILVPGYHHTRTRPTACACHLPQASAHYLQPQVSSRRLDMAYWILLSKTRFPLIHCGRALLCGIVSRPRSGTISSLLLRLRIHDNITQWPPLRGVMAKQTHRRVGSSRDESHRNLVDTMQKLLIRAPKHERKLLMDPCFGPSQRHTLST